jgi:hypothetical protein
MSSGVKEIDKESSASKSTTVIVIAIVVRKPLRSGVRSSGWRLDDADPAS